MTLIDPAVSLATATGRGLDNARGGAASKRHHAPLLRTEAPDTPPMLTPGTPVEVLNRFTGTWSCGFEVTEAVASCNRGRLGAATYRLRRCSDGSVLPEGFTAEAVRPRR